MTTYILYQEDRGLPLEISERDYLLLPEKDKKKYQRKQVNEITNASSN